MFYNFHVFIVSFPLRTSSPLSQECRQGGIRNNNKHNNHLPQPWAAGRGAWLSCLWCRPGWSARLGGGGRTSAEGGSPGSGLGSWWCGGVWPGSSGRTSSTCRLPAGEWNRTSSEGRKHFKQLLLLIKFNLKQTFYELTSFMTSKK